MCHERSERDDKKYEKELGATKFTIVRGDIDGDAIADFSIWLVGAIEFSALSKAILL